MTDIDTVHERLEQAHDHLAAAERCLATRTPGPVELHAAVDGVMRISTALADLVATVMRQAPATLDHRSDPVLTELVADLRAMHGCLTTGPLLLAPARDDLHQLLAHRHTTTQHGGPAMFDDAPAHDVADQQRLARPEPGDDEHVFPSVAETLDADPADVADQRRDAPVLDEGEPWP